jgi:hypothetical protein
MEGKQGLSVLFYFPAWGLAILPSKDNHAQIDSFRLGNPG